MADPVTKLEFPALIEMPESVTLSQAGDLRMSPNDMRELKAQTGRTLSELTGEGADEADALQTMAWLKLRRQGVEAVWSEMGDVVLEFQEAEPDPMSGAPSMPSPDSATTGE